MEAVSPVNLGKSVSNLSSLVSNVGDGGLNETGNIFIEPNSTSDDPTFDSPAAIGSSVDDSGIESLVGLNMQKIEETKLVPQHDNIMKELGTQLKIGLSEPANPLSEEVGDIGDLVNEDAVATELFEFDEKEKLGSSESLATDNAIESGLKENAEKLQPSVSENSMRKTHGLGSDLMLVGTMDSDDLGTDKNEEETMQALESQVVQTCTDDADDVLDAGDSCLEAKSNLNALQKLLPETPFQQLQRVKELVEAELRVADEMSALLRKFLDALDAVHVPK